MSKDSEQDLDLQDHLETVRDFVQRSTHWQEGGSDRHAALKEALPALEDGIEWLEKGVAEWRTLAIQRTREASAARATSRIAIAHLQATLVGPTDKRDAARLAAHDWLVSIGADEPGEST